jgi:hypothetical protein
LNLTTNHPRGHPALGRHPHVMGPLVTDAQS